MDRRQFLAAGGLAVAATGSPFLVGAASASDAAAPGVPATVNFHSDGLDLTPAEYAAVLQDMAGDVTADNYSIGGTIETLETTFAALLGKPAALWLPTGTLANHMALRALAGDRRRVLVQAESHVYNDTGDGASTLSALNLVPLAPGAEAFPLEEAQAWTQRTEGGRVPLAVGAIAIESPVRRRDHAFVDPDELRKLSAWARAEGIGLHLDAARGFNLAQHAGVSLREHAALFDTVMVSLWKHFNAKAGAILAGPAALLDGLRGERRMFGGSLPQAWPVTAPALKYAETYERDYAAAWRAADELFARLEASGRFKARRLPRGTCRVFVSAPGVDIAKLAERAAAAGVQLVGHANDAGEFPVQVNTSLLRRPVDDVARVLLAAAGA
jgi:threonine aldolase